jgi:Protein of unknown function (DUF3052)
VSGSGAGGYSGTPLAQKLGIRPGSVLALVGAPRGWSVPHLPDGVRVRRSRATDADVVLAFARRAAQLDRIVTEIAPHLPARGALWVCWPRRAAGHDSDVDENLVRAAILPTGLVDVKVAAVGEDWSGLRFVWRRKAP